MDRRHPVNRRLERSSRVTAAVVLLVGASAGVAGALLTRGTLPVSISAVVAIGCAWLAFRLTWTVVLDTRLENAVDRTALASSYRTIFAERSLEHRDFVSALSERLAARDRVIRELEGNLVGFQMRAIEAETTLKRFQVRLETAEGRLVTLEEHLATSRAAGAVADAELEQARREREDALATAEQRAEALRQAAQADEELRGRVVPEWADLEVDPTAALLAWEQHASTLAGRHSAAPDQRADTA